MIVELQQELAGFSIGQLLAVLAIFAWSGFVRTGLGFGGAALGLPLLLLVEEQPLLWLPIIGFHLLFFSSLNTARRLHNVDWPFVRWSLVAMAVPMTIGLIGLISLPARWMAIFVFGISAFYALTWILKIQLSSHNRWVDGLLLAVGGYTAGAALIGAPFIVVVAMRHVVLQRLRDTLFVLWFIIVVIKLAALAGVGVDLRWLWALLLLPVAAVGHVLGLKVHDWLIRGDAEEVKRWLGLGLLAVSTGGLVQLV